MILALDPDPEAEFQLGFFGDSGSGFSKKWYYITYRVSQGSCDLGWVDFDFCVPPSCPAAQPLLPNSHQPKQSQADSGTLKTQSQLPWDTLYTYVCALKNFAPSSNYLP